MPQILTPNDSTDLLPRTLLAKNVKLEAIVFWANPHYEALWFLPSQYRYVNGLIELVTDSSLSQTPLS